ncbi:MAG: NAD(P)H-binding protein [Phycisphaera sp.]|nr:NAD(P)H-binding protein [Phycisphaera sp.]
MSSPSHKVILVVGATGATGKHLVAQLLEHGHAVRVVVRSRERLPAAVRDHERLSITEAALLDLDDDKLSGLVSGCDAVASCLGHNMTFKGIWGRPRRLVTDAAVRLCRAIERNRPPTQVRFILMNTAGNSRAKLGETISIAQVLVVGLIRWLVPPHADNEEAAEYLRTQIGHEAPFIGWAVVRPDSLKNEGEVTEYEVHPSPTRSAIFNPGQTSRINVAHFMATLATEDGPWQRWEGRLPVIYNRATPAECGSIPG